MQTALRQTFGTLLLISFAAAVGCQEPSKSVDNGNAIVQTENGEPSQITVQHCLIAFKGTLPGKPIQRTQEEASKLANEILAKAKSGEDFAALIEQHTNDSPPGIYKMVNSGLPADMSRQVFSRDGMVPAFGDVGFKLEVGEFGISQYDRASSPFGFHIIKRIK
jgi:hypothetical protein